MKTKLTLFLSIIALAFAAAGCSKSARLPTTVTLKQENDESSGKVSLVLGDTLVVELPGNMTTGFQWEVSPIQPAETAGLAVVEGRYIPPQGGAVGAPGKFAYIFRTIHVGAQDVELIYRRSFEKDKPPAKRYTVHAMIK